MSRRPGSPYRQKRKGELGPLRADHKSFASLRFECYDLPHTRSHGDTCDPIIGVYQKNGSGKFTFVGQTERLVDTTDPIFSDIVDIVSGYGYSSGRLKLVVFDTDSPDHDLKNEDVITGCEVDLNKLRRKPKGIWIEMKRGGQVCVTSKWRDERDANSGGVAKSPLNTEYENHAAVYLEALDLPCAADGSCDPIVGVWMKPVGGKYEEMGQTEHLLKERNPVFQEPVNVVSPLDNDSAHLRIVVFDVAAEAQLKSEDKIGAIDIELSELRKHPDGIWNQLDYGGAICIRTKWKDWKRPPRVVDMERINELAQPKPEECDDHNANWAETNGSVQPVMHTSSGKFNYKEQAQAKPDPRDIYRKEQKERDYESLRGSTPRNNGRFAELAQPKPQPKPMEEVKRKPSKKLSKKNEEFVKRMATPRFQTTREEVKVPEGQMRPGRQYKFTTKRTNK